MSATQLRALAGTSPLRRRRLGPHVTITRPRPSPTAGESLLASSTRTSGPNSSPTPDADEVQGASSPGVPRRWRSAGWAPGRARRSEAPDRVRRFCSAYSSSPGLSVAGGRGRTGGTPPRQPPPGSPCGEKRLEPNTSFLERRPASARRERGLAKRNRGLAKGKCGRAKGKCGRAKGKCGRAKGKCGRAKGKCGRAKGKCGRAKGKCGRAKGKVRSGKREVWSGKREVRSDKREVRSRKREVRSCKREVRSRKREVRSRKREARSGKRELMSDHWERGLSGSGIRAPGQGPGERPGRLARLRAGRAPELRAR